MHGFIDGENIGTDLSHFLLGLCEIRLQGIQASFQVLATGMGYDDEGTEKGWVGSKKLLKMIGMNVIREIDKSNGIGLK
jgi:hypothetical protein